MVRLEASLLLCEARGTLADGHANGRFRDLVLLYQIREQVQRLGRGIGLGFAAGAVYVVARKGKEIDLPVNSGMLTRLDSTISVPFVSASTAPDAVATPSAQ